ncbi:unnamed protein product [Caretta caretta]
MAKVSSVLAFLLKRKPGQTVAAAFRSDRRGVPAFFERVALHLSSHSPVWPKIRETTAVLFFSDTAGIERFGMTPQQSLCWHKDGKQILNTVLRLFKNSLVATGFKKKFNKLPQGTQPLMIQWEIVDMGEENVGKMGNPMLSGTPSPSCSTDLSEDENTTLIRYFFKSDFCYDIYKKTFNK